MDLPSGYLNLLRMSLSLLFDTGLSTVNTKALHKKEDDKRYIMVIQEICKWYLKPAFSASRTLGASD